MVCFVTTRHSESALSLYSRCSKTSCEATPKIIPWINSDDPCCPCAPWINSDDWFLCDIKNPRNTEKKLINFKDMNTVMIQTIADYFKSQPVLKAWVFGSVARGEDTPLSDVDILVVYDHNQKVSLLKHASMICDLEDLLHRSVDLIEDGTLLPFAVESANKDRLLIYERAN